MFRLVTAAAVAAVLAACSGPVSKATCDEAAKPGKWDAKFTLARGPESCPKLEKSFDLPNGCEANCGCSEAGVVYLPSINAASDDTCALRLAEVCPAYELECRDVYVDGATKASGTCTYKPTGTGTVCTYSAEWTR